MTFTLKIELGNDAMQLPGHVADALLQVGQKLTMLDTFESNAPHRSYDNSGKIRDLNGHTVGSWEVK